MFYFPESSIAVPANRFSLDVLRMFFLTLQYCLSTAVVSFESSKSHLNKTWNFIRFESINSTEAYQLKIKSFMSQSWIVSKSRKGIQIYVEKVNFERIFVRIGNRECVRRLDSSNINGEDRVRSLSFVNKFHRHLFVQLEVTYWLSIYSTRLVILFFHTVLSLIKREISKAEKDTKSEKKWAYLMKHKCTKKY